VKLSIQKASKQRKFGRELNKVLKQQPGANPFATELRLKGKTSEDDSSNGSALRRSSMGSVWEIVEQIGGRPYYWNRVTNETTYDPPSMIGDIPLPPPPPPKYLLPGITSVQSLHPTAETTEEFVTHTTYDYASHTTEAEEDVLPTPTSSWVLVQEPNPYYWNTETNETTFELPLGVEITPYIAPTVTDSDYYEGEIVSQQEDQQYSDGNEEVISVESSQMWQEITSPSGETVYLSLVNGDSRVDKPEGVTIIITDDDGVDGGGESHWQECIGEDEDGGGLYYYYQNMATGEMRADRPVGLAMIAESV